MLDQMKALVFSDCHVFLLAEGSFSDGIVDLCTVPQIGMNLACMRRTLYRATQARISRPGSARRVAVVAEPSGSGPRTIAFGEVLR